MELLLLTFFVAPPAIFYAVYLLLKKNYNHWQKANIPCLPNPTPGFGHMWPVVSLQEHIGTFGRRVYNETKASMIGFFFIQKPMLFIRDPELIKNVLQTNFTSFQNNFIEINEKQNSVLSKEPSLITNHNEWKAARDRVISYFSNEKLRHLYVAANDVGIKLVDFVQRKIEENDGLYECELNQLFARFTGEVVANTAFAMDGQSFKDNPDKMAFVKLAPTLLDPSPVNGIKRTLQFFLPGMARFLNFSLLDKKTDSYFRENIKSIVKERRQSNTFHHDFLQFCFDENQYDIDSIIVDIIVFYRNVYKISSSTSAAMFYFLAAYKKVQQKLREDVRSNLEKTEGKVTYESLKNMTYFDQVMNESLRIISPLGSFIKVCTSQITLEGSDGLKCDLKPGDPVFISVTGLHMDPEYYPEPDIFNPERFSSENQSSRSKFVFLPFGEGPRMCVGVKMAEVIQKLSAAMLLDKFSVEYSSKTVEPFEYEPASQLSMVKGGLWAKFKKLD